MVRAALNAIKAYGPELTKFTTAVIVPGGLPAYAASKLTAERREKIANYAKDDLHETKRRVRLLGKHVKARATGKPFQKEFRDLPGMRGTSFESKRGRPGNLREVDYKYLTHTRNTGSRRKKEDRTILHRSLVADFLKRLQGGQ